MTTSSLAGLRSDLLEGLFNQLLLNVGQQIIVSPTSKYSEGHNKGVVGDKLDKTKIGSGVEQHLPVTDQQCCPYPCSQVLPTCIGLVGESRDSSEELSTVPLHVHGMLQ